MNATQLEPAPSAPADNAKPGLVRRLAESGWIGSVSFAVAFAAMIAIFGALRPDVFLSSRTPEIILTGFALALPVALAVTLPLIVGDFDLSVGAVASMAGGVAVALMVRSGTSWVLAIVLALLVAMGIGLINGALVALLRVSAFIVTLAMSSVALGVEYLFTAQEQLLVGADLTDPATAGQQTYVELGQGEILGLRTPLVISLVLLAIVWVFTRHVESGRRMYAIGSNEKAAKLVGINVSGLRIFAMVAAAVFAAVTGIVTTAQGAAYTPNSGAELLLPAFAAAFVGTAVFRAGRFTAIGTAIGLLFLETLSVGMIMLNLPTWALNVIQGAVLAVAVIVSRVMRGRDAR